MNISTENFTSSEVHPSTNFTTNNFSPSDGLRIGVLCLNLLTGVPIYAYVLWLIATGRNGVASDFFNFNLNFCEIFFSLTSLAFLLSERFPGLVTLQRFLFGLAITVRPLFQCLICIERFMAVLHPIDFLKFKPFRYKIVCSVFVWLMGLGSCLFCMFILLSFNMFAFTLFILIQFLPFLSIQLFCCLAVLRALKQSAPGERGRDRGEENLMKRKAFYLILINTVTMVIMFTPFIVMGFLYILQHHDISVVFPISFICFILAGFVQPILYLHRAGKMSCLCSS